eukprot:TRINITY_DN7672_c0_g1_i1.p1 TRINITY_DN7672_c0_g1~~TRINITY_DN7672_c0_g1_i1.p1  ORF type:complete len:193 (+),score=50.30 TRINITY_DN7672_c0_g1_i1:351-929(+)
MNLVHSTVIPYMGFKSIFVDKDFAKDRLFVYKHPKHDIGFAILSAFQLYDLSVMLFQDFDLDKFMHHVVTLAGGVASPYVQQTTFYPVAFFLTYVTYWPANIVWMFQKLGYKSKHPHLFKRLLFIRVVFFVLFRLTVCAYTIWTAVTSGDIKNLGKVHWLPRYLSPFNVSFLTLLNLKWTSDCWKSYLRFKP